MNNIQYKNLTPDDFEQVIILGTLVHGTGYLDQSTIQRWCQRGIKQGINAGFVVYDQQKLIGFRLTFSAEQWKIDKWSSVNQWLVSSDKVCYFKCNTVDRDYRGRGIGSKLLKLSIVAAQQQGATAGVSHLWRQSPGNSAVKYFTKCGGQLIKNHQDKWLEDSHNGYNCPHCGFDCHCVAAEMIIYF
jgi:ribosomal protein S18 acetylase RimI-like enzyme